MPTNTATPYNANIAPAPTNNATSVATGKPTYAPLLPSLAMSPVHSAILDAHDTTLKALSKPAPTAPLAAAPTNAPSSSDPITAIPAASQAAAKASGTFGTPGTLAPQADGGTSTTTPSTTFPGLIGQLASTAQGNIPIGQSAADIAAKYGEQIAGVGNLGAGQVAGDLSTGTTPIGEGNAAIASNAASSRISALSAAEQAALQGTGQQLTAQGQAGTGLNNAAGLVAPSASFPFVFNPATGTFTAPGAGGTSTPTAGAPTLTYNPATDSQTFAKSVMNHQIGYDDAIKALSYGSNGPNAAGQLSAAILAAGGNPTILQTQSGIQSDQEVQAQAYQSAHQQATLLGNQLQDLITSFGLNPSDINAANAGIQAIAKNTSDARYQILNNYLADVAARYSQILTPPGGSATDTTRSVATGMLNGIASGKSILDTMNALDEQAKAVTAGVRTIGSDSSNTGDSSGASSFAEQW